MAPAAMLATGLLALSGVHQRADASGCGKDHWFTSVTRYKSLTSSGTKRDFSVHLPSDYDKNVQYPVVLGFHGSDSIGFFFEADSKLSESRFSAKTIMVYPTALNGSWAGASYSKTPMATDIQFVDDLLAEVRSNYCVDSSRIYATGISNGGGFVGALACNDKVGGQIAAFAPASGAFYPETNVDGCTPSRAVTPILEFHGGNDKSVFYDGGAGSGGQLPAVSDWLSSWSQRSRCVSPARLEDSHEGKVHHSVWTCNGVAGAMEHYKIDDMGHVWPSTEINFSQLAALEGPTYIQASSLIMDFFKRFSLST